MNAVVEIRALQKSFIANRRVSGGASADQASFLGRAPGGAVTVALKNVDLTIVRGEMVALIGPSGSGKSTLLRHVAGLTLGDRGAGGRVSVLGNLVQEKGRVSAGIRGSRARIGYIFQQFNLVGRLSVMRNVLLGLLGRIPLWRGTLCWFRPEEYRLALEALTRVGMERCAWQRADSLSGGQQQRVAIARALVQRAEVILADEPIASLDPESARIVMEILRDINQCDGKTVIVTLHQVDYARRYCDRAVALRQGELCFDGPTSDLDQDLLQRIYSVAPDGTGSAASVNVTPPVAGLTPEHDASNASGDRAVELRKVLAMAEAG